MSVYCRVLGLAPKGQAQQLMQQRRQEHACKARNTESPLMRSTNNSESNDEENGSSRRVSYLIDLSSINFQMRTRNNGKRRANQLFDGGDDLELGLPPPTRRRRAPAPTTIDTKIERIEANQSEEIDDVPTTDEDIVQKLSQ